MSTTVGMISKLNACTFSYLMVQNTVKNAVTGKLFTHVNKSHQISRTE